MINAISKVVRVATTNNFGCSEKEWNQLDTFSTKNPDKAFFVNSNINTPKLRTIAKHSYKGVVTVNPDLFPDSLESILDRILPIKTKLAFVRVKYLPNQPDILNLINALIINQIPIVVTLQRFNSIESLTKYTDPSYYHFSCTRYRLAGGELQKITGLVDSLAASYPIWICDRNGLGCQGCGLCSRLTTNTESIITSLNLSSSGVCPYNCPDCYAKTMQIFSVKMGHNPIVFDRIQRNKKQAGTTSHIKEAKRNSLII
jgi:hypothetical protein